MKNYYRFEKTTPIDDTLVKELIDIDRIKRGVEESKKYNDYVKLHEEVYSSFPSSSSPFTNCTGYEKAMILEISQSQHSLEELIDSDSFEDPIDLAIHKILTDTKYFKAIYSIAEYFRINYYKDPQILKAFELCYSDCKEDPIEDTIEDIETDSAYDILSYVCFQWLKNVTTLPKDIPSEYVEAFFEIKKCGITRILIDNYLAEWNDLIYGVQEFVLEDILGLKMENS